MDNPNLLNPALFSTELWWQIYHQRSFKILVCVWLCFLKPMLRNRYGLVTGKPRGMFSQIWIANVPPRPVPPSATWADQIHTHYLNYAIGNTDPLLILNRPSNQHRWESCQKKEWQHTEISHLKRFEHIQIPAKLLDCCLWSNKNNINQSTSVLEMSKERQWRPELLW